MIHIAAAAAFLIVLLMFLSLQRKAVRKKLLQNPTAPLVATCPPCCDGYAKDESEIIRFLWSSTKKKKRKTKESVFNEY